MKTTELAPTPCPKCGAPNDRATSADQETPKPGDVSLCATCGAFLVFDDKLTPQPPEDEVEFLLGMDASLRAAILAMQVTIRMRHR